MEISELWEEVGLDPCSQTEITALYNQLHKHKIRK